VTSPHIAAARAPIFELPGIRFTGLAAPSRGSTDSAVWIVELAPGTPGSPHQLTREEVIVALEGRAVATVDGQQFELTPGDALTIQARTDFALANPFGSTFRAVAVLPVGGQAIMGENTFTPPWAS
jgi:mannose-6-phosphate isomerase-like protein (cupin superfamily)